MSSVNNMTQDALDFANSSGIRANDAPLANREALVQGDAKGLVPNGGYLVNSTLTAIQNSIFGGLGTAAVNKVRVALSDAPEDKAFISGLFSRIRSDYPDVTDSEQERLMGARNAEEYSILSDSVAAQRRLDQLGSSSNLANYGALALDIAPDILLGTKGSATIARLMAAKTLARSGTAVAFNAAQAGAYESLRQKVANEAKDDNAILTTTLIAGAIGGLFDSGLQFKDLRSGAVNATRAAQNVTQRVINGGKGVVDEVVDTAKAASKKADEVVAKSLGETAQQTTEAVANQVDNTAVAASKQADNAAAATAKQVEKAPVGPMAKTVVDDILGQTDEAVQETEGMKVALDDLFQETAPASARAHAAKSAKYDQDLSAIQTAPTDMTPVSAAPVARSSTDTAIAAVQAMAKQADAVAPEAAQAVDAAPVSRFDQVDAEHAAYNAKALSMKDGDHKVSMKFASPVDRALAVLGSKTGNEKLIDGALEVVQKAFPDADPHAIETMANDFVDNTLMPQVRNTSAGKKMNVARWWDEVDAAKYKDRIEEVKTHISPEETVKAVETEAKVTAEALSKEASEKVVQETIQEVDKMVTRETIDGGLKEVEAAYTGATAPLKNIAEVTGTKLETASVLEVKQAVAAEVSGRKAFDEAQLEKATNLYTFTVGKSRQTVSGILAAQQILKAPEESLATRAVSDIQDFHYGLTMSAKTARGELSGHFDLTHMHNAKAAALMQEAADRLAKYLPAEPKAVTKSPDEVAKALEAFAKEFSDNAAKLKTSGDRLSAAVGVAAPVSLKSHLEDAGVAIMKGGSKVKTPAFDAFVKEFEDIAPAVYDGEKAASVIGSTIQPGKRVTAIAGANLTKEGIEFFTALRNKAESLLATHPKVKAAEQAVEKELNGSLSKVKDAKKATALKVAAFEKLSEARRAALADIAPEVEAFKYGPEGLGKYGLTDVYTNKGLEVLAGTSRELLRKSGTSQLHTVSASQASAETRAVNKLNKDGFEAARRHALPVKTEVKSSVLNTIKTAANNLKLEKAQEKLSKLKDEMAKAQERYDSTAAELKKAQEESSSLHKRLSTGNDLSEAERKSLTARKEEVAKEVDSLNFAITSRSTDLGHASLAVKKAEDSIAELQQVGASLNKQGGFATPYMMLGNIALGSALFFAMTDDSEASTGGIVSAVGISAIMGKGALLLAGSKARALLKQKGIMADGINKSKKLAEKLYATDFDKFTKDLEDYALTDAAPNIHVQSYLDQKVYLSKVQRDSEFLKVDTKAITNPIERAHMEMAQEALRGTIERLKKDPVRTRDGSTVDFYDMTPAGRVREIKKTLAISREAYIEKVTGIQYRGLKIINRPPLRERPRDWNERLKMAKALRAWGPEDAIRDSQNLTFKAPLKRDQMQGTVTMQKDSILDNPEFKGDFAAKMRVWYASKTHVDNGGKLLKGLDEVITPEMRANYHDVRRMLDEEFLKLDPMDIRNEADRLRLEMVQEALRHVQKRFEKAPKKFHEMNSMERRAEWNKSLNEIGNDFIQRKTGHVKAHGRIWAAVDPKKFPELVGKNGEVTDYTMQQYLKTPHATTALTAYNDGPYLMLGGKALGRVAAAKGLMGESLVKNWDEAKRMFKGGADWHQIENSTGFTVRDGELVLKVEPSVFPTLIKGGQVDSEVLSQILEDAKAFAEDGTPLSKAVTFNLDETVAKLQEKSQNGYEKLSVKVNGKVYEAKLPHWLRQAKADYVRLAADKSKTAVGIGMTLATGVLTRVGKVATEMAADQVYKSTQTSNLGRVEKALQGNFKDWYAQTGRKKPNIINRKQILADREDFAKEVADAKQFPEDPKWSKAARDVAAEISKIEADQLKRLKDLVAWAEARGVKFAEDNPLKVASELEADPTFLSRVVNKDKWNAVEAAVGREGVIKLIAAGYKRTGTKLTPEKIDEIATGIYNTLTSSQDDMGVFISKTKASEIETKMLAAGENQENIDFVTSLFGVRSNGRMPGVLKKRRLELNMNATEKFVVDGKEVTYRLADLYERDITKLFGRWSHTMAGMEALGTAGLKDGINLTDDVAWDALRARMKSEGVDPENLKVMEAYRDLMLARAKDPDVFGNPGNVERLVRTAATYWLGSNFVLAQAGDIGGLGGRALTNFFKALPLMNEIRKGVASGKYNIEELRTLASMLDLGLDTISATTNNFVENGVDIGANTMERLVHFQHKINGMYFIMHAVKMAKAIEMQDFLVKYAKGEAVDERLWKHYSALGLDKKLADELSTMLNKPGMMKFDGDGVFKGINFEAMMNEDIVLARKLQMAMQKSANYANAQSVGFGETAQFFRANTLGRFLGQLQGTALFITQKAERDILNFDAHVMNAWITSMAFSAASYMARVGIRYAGDDEELKKKLTPQQIFLASIRNSSFAGIAPNVIDGFLSTSGIAPGGVFSGGSNSGRVGGELAVQAGFKTPVTALAGIMGLAKMSEHDVLTQAEARAAVQTFAPFWWMNPVMTVATNGLPTKNPKRPPDQQE